MTIRIVVIALALMGAIATISQGPASAQEVPQAQQAGVNLSFPWDGGDSWRYLWGPHTGNSGILAALDLQSPDAVGKPCGYVSDSWVVAAADGRVTSMANSVEIDHGNGFQTGYFHLADKQVTEGFVRAGDRLGRPDCCPDGGEPFDCYSTTPHLHFYTIYNGAKQDIHGINLQGWVLGSDDCFAKGAERKCQGASLLSNAPPPNDALPSARADVALVIDGSDPAKSAARTLLGALANGDRAAVFGYGSGAKQLAELATPAPSHPDAIDDAIPGAGDPARGISAACTALNAGSGVRARSVIAIGGGWHTSDALAEALPCFAEGGPKLFIYDTAGAMQEDVMAALTGAGVTPIEISGARDLPCEFQRLRSLISEDTPAACTSFMLRPGQVVAMPFTIPEGQTGATFSVRWTAPTAPPEGFDVRPVLLNHARERVSASTGVRIINGVNHETYSVATPVAGSWKLYVSADGLPAEGLTVRLTSTSAGSPAPGSGSTPTVTSSPEPTGTEGTSPSPSGTEDSTPTPPPTKAVVPKKDTPTPPPKPTPTPEETPAPTAAPTPDPTDTPGPLPTPSEPEPPPP